MTDLHPRSSMCNIRFICLGLLSNIIIIHVLHNTSLIYVPVTEAFHFAAEPILFASF